MYENFAFGENPDDKNASRLSHIKKTGLDVFDMLEIPESTTIARQLKETIVGKKVEKVAAAKSPHGFAWYFGDPSDYPRLLCGRVIDDVRANAGQVEIFAGEVRIVMHDGVNIRYMEPGARPPDKHQLYIGFEDSSAVVCTVQMYGGMMAFPEGAYDHNFYYTVAKEKPSPLSDEFSEEYFDRLVGGVSPKLSAKALLATEQRIPGLGNGCLQDILFQARVNPQTKLSRLADRDMKGLFRSVKDTLESMTRLGGRDTEKDLFGNPGGYRTLLSSKTAAYACPGCGGGIVRKAYLGGNVYFCPVCQPVLK